MRCRSTARPQLTIEENILPPLWVAEHSTASGSTLSISDRELAEMRDRKALLLSGGWPKTIRIGCALGIGTKDACCSNEPRGNSPALSERLSEVLASLKGKDLTCWYRNRHELFARADRRRVHDRNAAPTCVNIVGPFPAGLHQCTLTA